MADPRTGRRAVVVGAGIGGLAAARALSDRFETVIVLERDDLAAAAASRAGTPQDRHVHALLAGGLKALAELFPGIEDDLLRAGAVPLSSSRDVRVERPGFDPFPARDLGVTTYAASRPLIEFALRQQVERLPGTIFTARCRATELRASADGVAHRSPSTRRGSTMRRWMMGCSHTDLHEAGCWCPLPRRRRLGRRRGLR
jgi:2-polyprenyl-6-methoxyphenol hydroxylase-like FAD-dependent oxidoreductase